MHGPHRRVQRSLHWGPGRYKKTAQEVVAKRKREEKATVKAMLAAAGVGVGSPGMPHTVLGGAGPRAAEVATPGGAAAAAAAIAANAVV